MIPFTSKYYNGANYSVRRIGDNSYSVTISQRNQKVRTMVYDSVRLRDFFKRANEYKYVADEISF